MLISFSTTLHAADGSLGATSTGSSTISVTTTEMAQITNIANITVNPYGGSGGIAQDDDVCIYSNDAGNTPPRYKVTASGSGAASAFTITNGAQTIAYTVEWNNATGEGNNNLVTTVQSAAFSPATNTYPCAANNANFQVLATHNNVMSVPAGTYTGTLTLVIAPDDT